MPYTVGNGFYASTLTLILVLTYFGKKNPKNLPHPKLLQISSLIGLKLDSSFEMWFRYQLQYQLKIFFNLGFGFCLAPKLNWWFQSYTTIKHIEHFLLTYSIQNCNICYSKLAKNWIFDSFCLSTH